MFNRKLKAVIEDLQLHKRTQGSNIYNTQRTALSMQSTAIRQEAAIVALKKEAAIHVDKLKYNEINIQNLLNLTYALENEIDRLLKVIKISGIVEEAVKGEDLFQFKNSVDILQRNPLYKINKVVTK